MVFLVKIVVGSSTGDSPSHPWPLVRSKMLPDALNVVTLRMLHSLRIAQA